MIVPSHLEAGAIAAEAWADMYACASPALRRALGVEVVRDTCDVALVCPGLDHPLFNRARGRLGAYWPELFAAQGVRRFFVEVERGAGGPRGLERFHRDWARLARGLSGADLRPEPSPWRVADDGTRIRAATVADREAIGTLFEAGFELPFGAGALLTSVVEDDAWCALVAEQDGAIVGAALAYAHVRGAYLSGCVVAPRARGHGLQRRLVDARIAWAASHGCAFVVSETGVALARQPNPSHDNLVRAGLRVVGFATHYAPPGTTWASPAMERAS